MFYNGRGLAYNISAEEARSLTDYGPYSKNMTGEHEGVTGYPYSGGLGNGTVGGSSSGNDTGASGVEQQMGNGANGLGVSALAIAVMGAAIVIGA